MLFAGEDEDLQSHILEESAFKSEDVFKALASETRLKILKLLAEGGRNINELGNALQINLPTVSKHIQILENAGLVLSEYMAGVQGTQKRCRLRYDRLSFSLASSIAPETVVEEFSMPIGLYSRVNPTPPCGLVSSRGMIHLGDSPQSFLQPERAEAQLLWMSDGFVEYIFPNMLPTSVLIERVEVAAELCSEAPDYRNDYPSDITVWINGIEVGTWTSPGDFGGKRGFLNPGWWSDHGTQFGSLKLWSVTQEGSYVDGMASAETTLENLKVVPQSPFIVRIGIKPDAQNKGGFNLFGRKFGNHEQDLVLRLYHTPNTKPPVFGDRVSDVGLVPVQDNHS